MKTLREMPFQKQIVWITYKNRKTLNYFKFFQYIILCITATRQTNDERIESRADGLLFAMVNFVQSKK